MKFSGYFSNKLVIAYQRFFKFHVSKIIKNNDNAYHIRRKQHANSNTAIDQFWTGL